MSATALLTLPLSAPARVDSRADDAVKVLRDDTTDKTDFEVVLNGRELGIVNTGFLGQSFVFVVKGHSDGREAQVRLAINHSRFLADFVYNSMVMGFCASFGACFVFVGQDGSLAMSAICLGNQVSGKPLITYTQVLCPSSFATTMNRRMP